MNTTEASSPPRWWRSDAGIRHVDPDARTRTSDGGYVLILTAFLLLPLIAVTAFAVDLGAWYAQASRAQRAADAGALAGVVWATDATKWDTVARDVIRKNGFVDGQDGVAVDVERLSDARIEASISVDGLQYFSGVFQPGGQRITRQAVAEYVVPVPMGSPTNRLGNDPTVTPSPAFWLNVAGRATNKANGDRNTTTVCNNGTYGCTGTTNSDFQPDGYFFKMSVDGTTGQDLAIDVFDPAFVYTGDLCESGNLPTTGPAQYQRNNLTYCPGDQNLNGANIVTTYIVRGPDNTPLDTTDNPPICAISFDPYDQAVQPLLDSPAARGRENVPFSAHFHNWFRLCRIPSGQVVPGDYYIQVRTNADLTNAGSTPATVAQNGLQIGTLGSAATPNTGGHNRYSLRAGWVTSPTATPTSGGVGVSADGRLPIYVNVTAQSEFYLARITPDYQGKTLQLNFWDIGDISNGSATVTVVPPGDASNPPTSCTFTRDGGAMRGVTTSGCTVSGMTSTDYNNRLTQVTMPLPAGYSCNNASPSGCWFKVRITSTGSPTDTTTWSANVIGDPVHLIK